MKCPRCSAGITAAPDPGGIVTCSGCGARLRSARAAVQQPVAAGAVSLPQQRGPGEDRGDIDSLLSRLDVEGPTSSFPSDANPNVTLPPGTPLPRIPRPPALVRKGDEDTAKVIRPAGLGVATVPVVDAPAPASPSSTPSPSAGSGVTLESLLAEIHDVQRTQAEILELLRTNRPSPYGLPSMSDDGGASLGFPDDDAPAVPRAAPATPVRSRRRKTVLLIDDDEATRQAAVAALQTAEVPVRAVNTGNDGLAAIAEAKPDVIVMELDIAGDMGGKDVINMIKATMEWVDVPILLYTRVPIESQKEARTVHGGDEFVLKAAGADALVSRVIAIFRKG
jgi:CheY-like chemotaxis protein